jgi:hypothetical protein
LLECLSRSPVELALGSPDVEDAALDLTWSRRRIFGVTVDSSNAADGLVELVDGRLDSGSDVEDTAARAVRA